MSLDALPPPPLSSEGARIEFLVGPRAGRAGVLLRTNPDNEAQWLVQVDESVLKVAKHKIAECGAPLEGKFAQVIDDRGGMKKQNKIPVASPFDGESMGGLLRRCYELLIAPVAVHLEERLIIV